MCLTFVELRYILGGNIPMFREVNLKEVYKKAETVSEKSAASTKY